MISLKEENTDEIIGYAIFNFKKRTQKLMDINMEKAIIKKIEQLAPDIMNISPQMWIDFDREADVLYVSFEKPQNADDSEMEGDIIVHKRKNKIVGLSLLHASKFAS